MNSVCYGRDMNITKFCTMRSHHFESCMERPLWKKLHNSHRLPFFGKNPKNTNQCERIRRNSIIKTIHNKGNKYAKKITRERSRNG